ncbi:MAG TPA: hypothetical protein VHR66_14655, partial [Gemmataceae bacterium]|nr:hypothetical protein [Gemmataceae bacterium]
SFTVTNGAIGLVDLSPVNVVAGANNSATVTIEGTLADLNHVLRDGNLVYHPSQGFVGINTLSVGIDDNGNTGSGGPATDAKDLSIIVTRTPARLSRVENKPLIYAEGRGKVRVSAALQVSSPYDPVGARVAITGNFSAAEDALTWTPRTGIAGNYDAVTGILTFTGQAPAARYQAILRSVRYVNSSHNPDTSSRTIAFTVGNGSAVAEWSVPVTRTVQVKAVNTAPVLTVPSATLSGPSNVDLAINGINAIDVDANGAVERLTLRATNGSIGFASLGGLTIVSGSNNSAMLIVEGTLAQLNAALAANNLMFHPNANFVGAATLGLTLDDGGKSSHKAIRIRIG